MTKTEKSLNVFRQGKVPEQALFDFSEEDLANGKALLKEYRTLCKRTAELDQMMDDEEIFSDDEDSTSHESHPYWIEYEKKDHRKEEILATSIYVQLYDTLWSTRRRGEVVREYQPKCESLENKNRELEKMNSRYKKMVNDLEKSNDGLRKEVVYQKSTHSDLRDRNHSLHYENEALKLRVSELEKKLATVLSLVSSDK